MVTNAVRQPAVAELPSVRSHTDAAGWLEQSLVVDFRSGTEVMRMTMEGDDPRELRVVLAAVARAYLAEVDERENGQPPPAGKARSRPRPNIRIVSTRFRNRLMGSHCGLDRTTEQLSRCSTRWLAKNWPTPTANWQTSTRNCSFSAGAGKTGTQREGAHRARRVLVDERLRREPAIANSKSRPPRRTNASLTMEALFKPGATTPALTRAPRRCQEYRGPPGPHQSRPASEA